MDLSCTYLGFELPHPFTAGASPLPDDPAAARRLEDAGAAMIGLNSLFEEQITREELATQAAIDYPKNQFHEALSYLPEPEEFQLGPDDYLRKVTAAKEAVGVPVVGSLNGTTAGGWLSYAKLIEQAGADALELNLYRVESDADRDAASIEADEVAMVGQVCSDLKIPVAVKLSPFYTSLPNIAKRFADAGAEGLVIFNRFYQADLDVEELEPMRRLYLSDSRELLLRVRWAAILSAKLETDLAVTGGVHTVEDAVKAVMAGARTLQTVSGLLREGAELISRLRDELAEWLEAHEYASLSQMRGSMNLARNPDPGAFLRANYIHILQNWSTTLVRE